MEAIEAILTRRSIRHYTEKSVPEEVIYKLLEAAMCAPSARNYQPWQFIVITHRQMLDRIPEVHPYAEMLRQAPLAILICGDKELEPNADYLNQDCSAATENLLIAANALGLGAVWLGVFPQRSRVEGLTRLFCLPENIIPISLVSLGFPAEIKINENHFNETRIHYDKW